MSKADEISRTGYGSACQSYGVSRNPPFRYPPDLHWPVQQGVRRPRSPGKNFRTSGKSGNGQVPESPHRERPKTRVHSFRIPPVPAWLNPRVFDVYLLKSFFPPDFSISFNSLITISGDSDLHMSYTVSAATEAPVKASISTPVLPETVTVQSMSISVLLVT